MKKLFTSFLLGAMLLISGTVKAQDFSATVEDDMRTGWTDGVEVKFSIKEVAAKLGVTPGQLVDAYDEWASEAGGNNAWPFPGLLWLDESETVPTFHSEQFGGFEMDENGNFDSCNGTATWGVYIRSLDIETDELTFVLCQNLYNNAREGTTNHGIVTLTLKNIWGIDASCTFEFTLKIKAQDHTGEIVNETDFTKLNIVKEFFCTIHQDNNVSSEYYWIPSEDILEALDIDENELYANVRNANMLYVKTWDEENMTWGPLTNKTNETSGVPSPGFWFTSGAAFPDPDDPDGNYIESNECFYCANGSSPKFYIGWIDYQIEWHNIFCQVGQAENAFANGENVKCDVYIVYGDKAAVIHYDITVGTPDQVYPGDLEKVGEMTWKIENRDPRKIWDELEYTSIDLDELAKQFSESMGKEVTKDDFVFMSLNKYYGLTDVYTADNYIDPETGVAVTGFWTSPYGIAGEYSDGSTAYYVNYFSDGTLGLGNKPNFFDGGEDATGQFFIVVDGTHYYQINLVMSVMLPPYGPETIFDCEISDYNLTVQLIPTTDSSWQVGVTSAAGIEEFLGMANLAFFGVDSEGNINLANNLITEVQNYGGAGYWMSPADATGYAYAATYTGEGAFAIWYHDSQFTWFNQPGIPQFGTETTALFYMANFWDGKVAKVNLKIQWVENIIEVKPLGTEEVVVNARDAAGEDFDEVALDLTKCLEALNCSEEEFLENGEWRVVDRNGNFTTEGFTDMYGFNFNAKGQAVEETAEDAEFQLGFIDGTLHSFVIDEANIAKHYEATLYAVYNEKLYAFNVVINPIDDAIANVATDNKSAAIYDLAGRRVNNPTRGIYISAGKKFMVK